MGQSPSGAAGMLLRGSQGRGRGCSHLLTRTGGRTGFQAVRLTGAGMSLQGHLNWPPFCLVMLNVTHLAHQVTIDRFNRKVSASESQSSGSGQQSVERPKAYSWLGTGVGKDNFKKKKMQN